MNSLTIRLKHPLIVAFVQLAGTKCNELSTQRTSDSEEHCTQDSVKKQSNINAINVYITQLHSKIVIFIYVSTIDLISRHIDRMAENHMMIFREIMENLWKILLAKFPIHSIVPFPATVCCRSNRTHTHTQCALKTLSLSIISRASRDLCEITKLVPPLDPPSAGAGLENVAMRRVPSTKYSVWPISMQPTSTNLYIPKLSTLRIVNRYQICFWFANAIGFN